MSEWYDKDDALTTARKRAKWDEDAAAIAQAQDRISELEAFADSAWRLSMVAQAEIDNGDHSEANERLVDLAELAECARLGVKPDGN